MGDRSILRLFLFLRGGWFTRWFQWTGLHTVWRLYLEDCLRGGVIMVTSICHISFSLSLSNLHLHFIPLTLFILHPTEKHIKLS
jgi:hypothetical protein